MSDAASAIICGVMNTHQQFASFAEATGSALDALLLGLLLTQAG